RPALRPARLCAQVPQPRRGRRRRRRAGPLPGVGGAPAAAVAAGARRPPRHGGRRPAGTARRGGRLPLGAPLMAATVTTNPTPKKSVALSAVLTGNTELCTAGRTGNDLHYRGYDILDIDETCEFQEIAHLLVHCTLPTLAELAAYKTRLKAL